MNGTPEGDFTFPKHFLYLSKGWPGLQTGVARSKPRFPGARSGELVLGGPAAAQGPREGGGSPKGLGVPLRDEAPPDLAAAPAAGVSVCEMGG